MCAIQLVGEVKLLGCRKLVCKWSLGFIPSCNPHVDMGVSENSGTPKSSILIGFSIINHPFWGTTIFGNSTMGLKQLFAACF